MFGKSSLEILTAVFICVILSFCSKGSKEQKQRMKQSKKIAITQRQVLKPNEKDKNSISNKSKKNENSKIEKPESARTDQNDKKNENSKNTDKNPSKFGTVENEKNKKNETTQSTANNVPQSGRKAVINNDFPHNDVIKEVIYKGTYKPLEDTIEELNSPAIHHRAVKNATDKLTIDPKYTKYKGNIDSYATTTAYKKELDEFLESLGKPDKPEKSEKTTTIKDDKRVKIINACTLVEVNNVYSDDDEPDDNGEEKQGS